MSQFESGGRKRLISQLKAVTQEEFPLAQAFYSIQIFNELYEAHPPTLGKAIFFTQPIDLNVRLILKHSHKTPRIIFDQYLAIP